MPSTVTSIGHRSFYESTVEIVTFAPDSKLTKIDSVAFADAKRLLRLVLPEGLATLSGQAFYNAAATEVVLPASLANLGTQVFEAAAIPKIVFSGPSKLNALSSSTFRKSKVRVLQLPASVTAMHSTSLEHCVELEELWMPISVAHKDLLHVFYNYRLRNITLLAAPGGGTSEVQAGAFDGMKQLTAVQLPAGKVTIGKDAFRGTGVACTVEASTGEASCATLTVVSTTKPPNATPDDTCCACKADVRLEEGTDEIPHCGFSNYAAPFGSKYQYKGVRCTALKSIHVPATVNTIGYMAFYASTVEIVTFAPGSRLTRIDDVAFSHAKRLLRLVLPEGLASIGGQAFWHSVAAEVVLPASLANLGAQVFEAAAIPKIVFNGPSKLKTLPSSAFRNSKLRVLQLPASVTAMNSNSLRDCRELGELWMPISLAHKDVLYLSTNTKLRNITLLATPGVACSEVLVGAFEDMAQLTSVQLPAGVTKIGAGAFKGTGITGAVMPNADPSSCTMQTCTAGKCHKVGDPTDSPIA